MRATHFRRPAPVAALATVLAVFSMSGTAGTAPTATMALADVALDAVAEPELPELHRVFLVDGYARRMLAVEGAFLGSERGKVVVGGKRARVKSWSDTAITVRVHRRVGGGVRAVEVVTRTRLSSVYPLPVALPGATRLAPHRLKFRKGRSRWHRFPTAGADADPSSGICTLHFDWSRKLPTTRGKDNCRYGYLFYICDRFIQRNSQLRRVELKVPLEAIEPGAPFVCTAASQDGTEPFAYWVTNSWMKEYTNGKRTWDDLPPRKIHNLDSAALDWWIVIGRTEDGAISGQFHGFEPSPYPDDRPWKPREFNGTFSIPTAP